MADPPQPITQAEPGFVEVAEPETRVHARPGHWDPDDWLCARCLNPVASEKQRFEWEGRSEFSFTNPAGVPFDIILFSKTIGCRQIGDPTLEHTWFPGCAWSFCACGGCGAHLGWFYTGTKSFAGLIRGHIVRAAVVMN